MQNRPEFQEGEDYYLDEEGLLVMTAAFLKKRGFCCHNNCRHCPYDKEVLKNTTKKTKPTK